MHQPLILLASAAQLLLHPLALAGQQASDWLAPEPEERLTVPLPAVPTPLVPIHNRILALQQTDAVNLSAIPRPISAFCA
jgi:hypothetical protein